MLGIGFYVHSSISLFKPTLLLTVNKTYYNVNNNIVQKDNITHLLQIPMVSALITRYAMI